jgi:hypothetical protein
MARDRVNFTYLLTTAITATTTATRPITCHTDENVLKMVTARYAVLGAGKFIKLLLSLTQIVFLKDLTGFVLTHSPRLMFQLLVRYKNLAPRHSGNVSLQQGEGV